MANPIPLNTSSDDALFFGVSSSTDDDSGDDTEDPTGKSRKRGGPKHPSTLEMFRPQPPPALKKTRLIPTNSSGPQPLVRFTPGATRTQNTPKRV